MHERSKGLIALATAHGELLRIVDGSTQRLLTKALGQGSNTLVHHLSTSLIMFVERAKFFNICHHDDRTHRARRARRRLGTTIHAATAKFDKPIPSTRYTLAARGLPHTVARHDTLGRPSRVHLR